MSSLIPIIELQATHYDFDSKKWHSGTFSLHATCVRFQGEENESDGSFKNLRISLNSVSGIERKQSSLIYPAIIITSGLDKYWFSSFPNRDSVYNILELFWKQPLLPNSPTQPRPAKSALGKELLSLLQESEKNLTEVAAVLSNQGKQLQESEAVLSDVNVELTKAQKFLNSMNFLGSISTMFLSKAKAIDICNEQECRQKHYIVTYTFNKSGCPLYSWQAGTLVGSSELSLLDEQRRNKMNFSIDEVQKISVLSSWEFCIVYRSNDTPKSCHIMCSQLKSLIKFLSSFPVWRSKIIQDNYFCENDIGSSVQSSTATNLPSILPLDSANSIQADQINDLQVYNAEQTLNQESVVSKQDIDQISSMLNNLQALATDVYREQRDHMDVINTLLTDVDKTDLRIQAHNKEIKKLM